MVSSPYMLTGWGELSSFGWGCLGPHTWLWEQSHPWREGKGRELGSRGGGAEWPRAAGWGISLVLCLPLDPPEGRQFDLSGWDARSLIWNPDFFPASHKGRVPSLLVHVLAGPA